MPRGKHWVFTLNNFTEEEVERVRALGEDESCRYVVFGREVGGGGTPHLQGYICFTEKRTMGRAKDAISARAHIEIMRGNPTQASDYCKKDGDFEEFGEVPGGKGHRSDLKSALIAIRGGMRKRDLIESHPNAYARAFRMLTEYALLNSPCREWKTVVQVYFGIVTGLG